MSWSATKSNRSAIGSRVTARYGGKVQAQEVTASPASTPSTIAACISVWAPATAADLTIRWPNGGKEIIRSVAANQLVVIKEGAGVIREEKWPRR